MAVRTRAVRSRPVGRPRRYTVGDGVVVTAALHRLTGGGAGVFVLLRLLPRVNRLKVVCGLVLVVLAAVLPVVAAVLTGLVVGRLPAVAEGGLHGAAGRRMVWLLAVVGCLIVLQRVVESVLSALGQTLGREVDRYLQQLALAAVARPQELGHLEDSEVLAALHVVRGLGLNDSGRPSLAVAALAVLLPSWFRALGGAVVLLAFSWWLGLVWLMLWPLVVFGMQREYLRVGQVGYEQSGAMRRAEYLRDLATTPPAAKELRIWGMLDWLMARFEGAWRTAIEPVTRQRRPRTRVVWGTVGAISLINLFSYGLLVLAVFDHRIALAGLVIFSQALAMTNNYTAFDDQNAQLSIAAVGVPKVLELDALLELPVPAADAYPRALLSQGAPSSEIRFSGVHFRYPSRDDEALRGLDLTIEAGRSLAVVGENGAGKTSLMLLLCGLYRPTAGTVSVDGQDIAQLAPTVWSGRIGALFQDFTRYHLSAAQNIQLGAPAAVLDDRRLWEAAEKAGATELIEALPQGWDTILSPEYEGGTDLSGGQWQRIALARALYAVAAGADVLILDEPTAALDVRAEAELYDRFLELTAGLTTILVSHRFSTVRRADRIVVLEQGVIVEDGRHDTLMASEGRYAHMFDLQAARFVDQEAENA